MAPAMRPSHLAPRARRSPRAGVVLASVLLLATSALTGCAARRSIAPSDAPPLRVGTSGDYPPFSVRTATDDWRGFDVEVAHAYAAARGRAVVFVPFRWPELTAQLAAGAFDVAMSGVTVRADRLLVGTMTASVATTAVNIEIATTNTLSNWPTTFSGSHNSEAFRLG